jgi:hypothetical protein
MTARATTFDGLVSQTNLAGLAAEMVKVDEVMEAIAFT